MKRMSISGIRILFSGLSLLLLNSCEKEEFGDLLIYTEKNINSIYWTESSDYLIFSTEEYYYSYTTTLYAVELNTGTNHKIASIQTQPGNRIYEKDGKIFFFNDLEYNNTKFCSVSISGSSVSVILDSLESPVFSEQYVAYMKSFYFPDTSYSKTILYNIDNKEETVLSSGRNEMPLSISPDGSRLLLRTWDFWYNQQYLTLYETSTGERRNLTASAFTYFYDFFWIDNEPYAHKGTNTGYEIVNIDTGQKLTFGEDLTYEKSVTISPSGNFAAYVVEEYPALAGGMVGNHYYLHLLAEGSGKRVYDLEREYVNSVILAFSPDEKRIAYIRDYNNIYLLDL